MPTNIYHKIEVDRVKEKRGERKMVREKITLDIETEMKYHVPAKLRCTLFCDEEPAELLAVHV